MATRYIVFSLIIISTSLNAQDANPLLKSMDKYSVFGFSQGDITTADTQVFAMKPDMNIRAWSQWKNWGTKPAGFKNAPVEEYRRHSIKLIGGVVATVYFFEQAGDSSIFKDMVTRDGSGNFVKHTNGAYRGNIANPKYREYVLSNVKLQIDRGVDGIFLDEVLGGYSGAFYNGNEGFDEYHLQDFNKYLAEKYPEYTLNDWISKFKMSEDNFLDVSKPLNDLNQNFNYIKYLKDHSWNETPLASSNPLSKEWGKVIENRARPDLNNFLSKYTMIYWEDLAKKIRSYGREKFNKEILITSNGIMPYVDFNSLGMYNGNSDDDGLEARYVPEMYGHLRGSVSLQDVFKSLYEKSKKISNGAPVVLFIDWPTQMMNRYYKFPLQEKQDYWKIYAAEAYANGLFMAFHLKTTMPKDPTAFSQGMLDFFEDYPSFYKKNSDFYHRNKVIDKPISISEPKINSSTMFQEEESRYTIHLVNHNYVRDTGMIEKKNFKISLPLDSLPQTIHLKSPDYTHNKSPEFTFINNELTINVPSLKYYTVIVLDYRNLNEGKKRKKK
jgi:hypothetical protein